MSQDYLIGEGIERVVFDENTAATHEVIAAVASKRFKIVFMALIAGGNVNVTFKSATTALSGVMAFTTATPGIWTYNEAGWFETAINEAFQITLSGAVQLSGVIGFVRID